VKTQAINGWQVNFDEASHTYSDSLGIIPGVSGILKAAGKIGHYSTKDTTARDRGTAVHHATELMDNLGLTPLDFDESDIHSYLTAWAKWQMESGAEMLEVERLVGCGPWRYAGTMDRLGKFNCIWHRLQLAAYATAYTWETGKQVDGGIAIYIKANGKYTTNPITGSDWIITRQEWATIARNHKEKHS